MAEKPANNATNGDNAPVEKADAKGAKVSKPVIPNRDLSAWVSPDLWEKYKDKFEPGDLVEFRREGKLFQHWGLYLGDNLVVHVSSYDLWHPFAGFGDRFINISQASGNASTVSAVPMVKEAAMEMKELASDIKEIKEAVTGASAENEADESVPCVHCEDVVVEASPLELGYGLEDRTKWFIKVEHILRIAGRDQFRVNNVAQRTYKRAARTPREIFQLVNFFKDKEVDYSLMNSNCEHFVTSLKYKNDSTEDPDVVPIVMTPCGTSSQVRRAVTLISVGLAAIVGLAGAAVVSLLTHKSTQPDSSGKIDVPATKKPKIAASMVLPSS